jgi:hypothetical protein
MLQNFKGSIRHAMTSKFGVKLMTALDFQLDSLAKERLGYTLRVKALIGSPDHQTEIEGYLRMIEQVNDAAIRLARNASEPGGSLTWW